MDVPLFPFADYWWIYALFTALILVLLLIDLGVFHRTAHAVSFREAAIWSVVWVALALLVNYGLYRYALWAFAQDERLLAIPDFDPARAARQSALEFLTGYVVEKSLAVDNIFVFVVVFHFFGIPDRYQHRILFYGILGALVFRAIFIALGAALMQYHLVVVLFGVFLIVTGIKMLLVPETKVEPERNPLLRLFRRYVPVTSELQGQRFFLRLGGRWHATPLFVTLLFVEMSDIIFAVDSVPAIFALTDEPLIVFTSNVCAVLGLRAMYFLLAGVIHRFHLVKYGLALILVFVGVKMVWLNRLWGGMFPIGLSLGIIGALLGMSVILSLVFPPGMFRRAKAASAPSASAADCEPEGPHSQT
jgi:tellurite resistance protein TerC